MTVSCFATTCFERIDVVLQLRDVALHGADLGGGVVELLCDRRLRCEGSRSSPRPTAARRRKHAGRISRAAKTNDGVDAGAWGRCDGVEGSGTVRSKLVMHAPTGEAEFHGCHAHATCPPPASRPAFSLLELTVVLTVMADPPGHRRAPVRRLARRVRRPRGDGRGGRAVRVRAADGDRPASHRGGRDRHGRRGRRGADRRRQSLAATASMPCTGSFWARTGFGRVRRTRSGISA